QSASWKAFVMPGRPESHSEPTLSMSALEILYGCLPQLTSERLAISGDAGDTSSRAKRRRAKKAPANEPIAIETGSMGSVLLTPPPEAVVSYGYSLYRPGGHPSAGVDGRADKT
ncbi:hypothetical protein GGI21_005428, partial [Coemansia aciculifera]